MLDKGLWRTLLLLFVVQLGRIQAQQLLLQQQQQFVNGQPQSQLSAQQQGQILSDIQQHQHKFNQQPVGSFQPQHFAPNTQQQQSVSTLHAQSQRQPFLSGNNNSPLPHQLLQQAPAPAVFQQRQQQQSFNNHLSQQPLQLPRSPVSQESFAQHEFLNTLPLVNSLSHGAVPPTEQSPISSGSVRPLTTANKELQHHTQTSFTPNYIQEAFQQQATQLRPTQDPLQLIEQQIKTLDPEKHKQKIKELREKQAIIEKHNQFVEKQYEKALKKAQQDHQEFLEQQKEQKKKLYQRLYKVTSSEQGPYSLAPAPRVIYPEEIPLFEQVVKQYYVEHPTTTTTTSTTQKPSTSSETKSSSFGGTFLPTALPPATKVKTIQSLEDLDQLQKQYKLQKIGKKDLLEQLRLAISNSGTDPKNLASREVSLENGKRVQLLPSYPKDTSKGQQEEINLPDGKKVTLIRADNPNSKQDEEVLLPSGHQVQIIRTTDPKSILQSITLPKGQKLSLLKSAADGASNASISTSDPTSIYKSEEITLPNGEKIEVIRTNNPNLVKNGVKIESGSDLEKLVLSRSSTTTTTIKPPEALLEELTKSGVPISNYEILKTGASGGLESVGKKLPHQKKVTFVLLEEQGDGTLKVQGIRGNGGKDNPDLNVDSILKKIKQGDIKLPPSVSSRTTISTEKTTTGPSATTFRPVFATVTPNSFAVGNEDEVEPEDIPILKTNIGTQIVSSSTTTSLLNNDFAETTGAGTTAANAKQRTRTPHILNQPQHQDQQSNDLSRQASISQNSVAEPHQQQYKTVSLSSATTPSIASKNATFTASGNGSTSAGAIGDFAEVLKRNEMFAMAKFLRQSGLDTILNETGPYTVFVPTDKAFRTLLVQLGGPERAEEKFKENPRLLSGLLLHHVIPGAFKIEALQDEMTGVSLAGTQLRVNQYNMHDAEWNDIKITTINGAKVTDEKKDIWIPQGIAHGIDRVMFPLPVGDIVQTLQSDRERRFTTFLRIIFGAGMADTLQGSKTFTLFAPTERAFSTMSPTEVAKLVEDKQAAQKMVLRHLLVGTLYTAGMRYYQIRNSMLDDKILTFSKQGGKVKVNNIIISTQNIPSTNGVVHAIDSLL